MSNFAFNNQQFQQHADPRNIATYPGAPQQAPQQPMQGAQMASFQHAGMDAALNAQLEGMYTSPAAGAHETDRMTVEDTIWKTAALFGIMLVVAVVGWFVTLGAFGGAVPPTDSIYERNAAIMQLNMIPWIVGAIGTLVISLVLAFGFRRKLAPTGLIFTYAVLEGLFVGGISAFFEVMWPGVVMQATLATVAVVGVTLALFASGKIRASKKATKIFMIALLSYLAFSVLNFILMITGINQNMFGLRGEVVIAGIPLGLIIGVLVVIMAAYSLVLDFDFIQRASKNGAPRQVGWQGALGVMVTVVWLYVEILRIIAIARGNN